MRWALVGIVCLVGAAGCRSDDQPGPSGASGPRRESPLPPARGAVEECAAAEDEAMCLVQRLDGPSEKEPLVALINAHEELGNAERARELRERYVALFDDPTAALFARELPPASEAPADETAEDPDDEAAEEADDEAEGREGEAGGGPPAEGSGDERAPRGNPIIDCASEPNYNACIMRDLRRPSTPREYEALINAYRETGQRDRSCALMTEVTQRYPSSPAAQRFGQWVLRNCP